MFTVTTYVNLSLIPYSFLCAVDYNFTKNFYLLHSNGHGKTLQNTNHNIILWPSIHQMPSVEY